MLANHGPTHVLTGPPNHRMGARCLVAPFEDCLFLLLDEGSDALDGLLEDIRVDLQARHPDGDYALHLTGRGAAGLPVMSHPRRLEILPWLPEQGSPRSLVACPFWPEHVSFQRRAGGRTENFQGATPGSRELPSPVGRMSRLAFEGAFHVPVLGSLLCWGWVVRMGPDTALRYVALALMVPAIFLLFGGARLAWRAASFHRWRSGRLLPSDAPLLVDGLLAPRAVRRVASLALGLGTALLLPLALWGPATVLVTLGATMLWVLGPVWLAHLAQSAAETTDLRREAR